MSKYKVVNPNGAVIRESTDAKSAKIGKLVAGALVDVAHVEEKFAQLVGGGFVIASTIEPSDSTETAAPAAEAPETTDAQVVADEQASSDENVQEQRQGTVRCAGYKSLNVRQEPSQQASVVAELADGTPVLVEKTSDDGVWYRVDDGWVMAAFIVL